MKSADSSLQYDIFLSHRFLDAELILGLTTEIIKLGHSVFVDWIVDPTRDRTQVTPETAQWLREAMNRSNSLFFAATTNSLESKWMPWELGYCDGKHGKVAIVPIADSPTNSESYVGQEYLGLYPYVTKTAIKDDPQTFQLWINRSEQEYVQFTRWLEGVQPIVRTQN